MRGFCFYHSTGFLVQVLPWNLSYKILKSRDFFTLESIILGWGQWIFSHYPYRQTTSDYCFYAQISRKNQLSHPQNSLFTSKYPWIRQLSPFCSWRCWFSLSRHSKMGICNIDLKKVWTDQQAGLHSAQWCCCRSFWQNTREMGKRLSWSPLSFGSFQNFASNIRSPNPLHISWCCPGWKSENEWTDIQKVFQVDAWVGGWIIATI